MFTLLDAVVAATSPPAREHWIVVMLQKPEVAVTFIGTVTAAIIASIVGISAAIEKAKRATREAAVPPIVVDPALAEMRKLLEEARREAAESRGAAQAWRNSDAEERLEEMRPEMRRLKDEIVAVRALNAGLTRQCNELRMECARLQLELDSSATLEPGTDLSEWGETTPARPRRRT